MPTTFHDVVSYPGSVMTSANLTWDPQTSTHPSFLYGAIVPTGSEWGGIFVASPNSRLTKLFPSSGARRVRLWMGLHFSLDDPLHFPQPFDQNRGHLACIPRCNYPHLTSLFCTLYNPLPSADAFRMTESIARLMVHEDLKMYEDLVAELQKDILAADMSIIILSPLPDLTLPVGINSSRNTLHLCSTSYHTFAYHYHTKNQSLLRPYSSEPALS